MTGNKHSSPQPTNIRRRYDARQKENVLYKKHTTKLLRLFYSNVPLANHSCTW